jgi:hypothetical protein
MIPHWFEVYADKWFRHHLADMAGKPNLQALQLGAFSGDATIWLLENVLTGEGAYLDDVDTWEGTDEPQNLNLDWSEVRHLYDVRTKRYTGQGLQPLTVHHMTTHEFLTGSWTDRYDFIYIDADHHAPAVLSDAVLSWPLLKEGGLLAFDDYLWIEPGMTPNETPRPAIDAFMSIYSDEFDRLPDPPWAPGPSQVWLRRR